MFINFATDWNDIVCESTPETECINSVIRMARTKRIQVGGPFRFWVENMEYFDLEDNPEGKEGRTLVEWRSEVDLCWSPYFQDDINRSKKYAHDHSVDGKPGGSHYDISKFSKSERRQLQY